MKHQIIRMKMRKGEMQQQHYNVETKAFEFSGDRWAGEFVMEPDDANILFAKVRQNCRKVPGVSMPKLHEIIG